jgi:hypothetical protein
MLVGIKTGDRKTENSTKKQPWSNFVPLLDAKKRAPKVGGITKTGVFNFQKIDL